MTLEQLMSKKGYSAQEIKDLEPLLTNARFRSDLEAELTNGEKALTDLNTYEEWFTKEVAPEQQNMRIKIADLESENAGTKAAFEAYKKASMGRQGAQQDPAAAAAAAEEEARKAREAAAHKGLDPDKFVTREVLTDIADRTGDAMANAIDITTKHMQLFPGNYLNMSELRNEAKAAKMPVKQFWEQKYKVKDREAAIVKEAKDKELAEAESRGYQKAAVEFGASNPNLRMPVASTSPFVTRKVEKDAKQPWERNENELTKSRIEKAIQSAAKRGELVGA